MQEILKTEIKYIKGVGPKRAEAFSKLGLKYASDLLNIYPRMYLINVKIRQLAKYKDQNVLIRGKVIDKYKPMRPNHPTRIVIFDGTGSIESLLWGNTFYREKKFNNDDEYIFWGKISYNRYEKEYKFDLRDYMKISETDEEFVNHPLIPIYILPEELKKKWIKPLTLTKIIYNAINSSVDCIEEILNEPVRIENDMLSHKKAVLNIHYPQSFEEIEVSRTTLAFEELFYLQLIMALRKFSASQSELGIKFENKKVLTSKFLNEILPFRLTKSQKKVINEIFNDMCSNRQMNRLLQGDVGSGKTIVAIFSILLAVENGYQAAFMCPTELLAEQHYNTLNTFLNKLNVKCVLLAGGQNRKMRNSVLDDIKTGIAQVVVGTHALIQSSVEFKSLGLAVIDEQHKFGVLQRAKLKHKGSNPDVLVMTATPIPRTLSLTIYGDLDVSIIDELPQGRKPVITALRFEKDRIKVYNFIREQVKLGRQVYIVYPIIEESEKLDLKSAIKHYEILKNEIFPDLKVGLVNGNMFWYEIDETITLFINKKIDILVATTVIEVGIDIPNATIMIIEEAQRFGLSQLHQLRGRVGRGAEQSYCILMAEKSGENSEQRLNIMTQTNNGFKIAELDLQLRGPGEFFGVKQSGELKFNAADIMKDKEILEKARNSAFRVVDKDPQLRSYENSVIRKHFLETYKDSVELIKVA